MGDSGEEMNIEVDKLPKDSTLHGSNTVSIQDVLGAIESEAVRIFIEETQRKLSL